MSSRWHLGYAGVRDAKNTLENRAVHLKAIFEHLDAARMAIGEKHPLSIRISQVQRSLTPNDSLWRNDAVSAQTELLAICTKLGEWPDDELAAATEKFTEAIVTKRHVGVQGALAQITQAIELL